MIRKLTYEEILEDRKSIEQVQIESKHPISIILHNIRSLYNVGSFFRTCDSALVDELILTGYTPFPPRKEIDKTALGATQTINWHYEKDIFKAMQQQKSKNQKIFAVELTNTKRNYDTISIEEFPICLVFGNELTGIPDAVISECDDAIEIPMFGVKHSLNVSVAGGIAIYEAVKVARSLYYK